MWEISFQKQKGQVANVKKPNQISQFLESMRCPGLVEKLARTENFSNSGSK